MVHLTDDVSEGRSGERTDSEMRNQRSMRAKVTVEVSGMRRPAVRKKGRVMAADARRARQQRDQEMLKKLYINKSQHQSSMTMRSSS